MAGKGSRLSDLSTPKPFIPIAGQTVLEWSVRWLALAAPSAHIVLIAQKSVAASYERLLTETMNSIAQGRWRLLTVDHETRGQLETCMFARDVCKSRSPVVIHNCDTFVSLGECPLPMGENFVSIFSSRSPNYGYVSVGEDSRVEAIIEKSVLPQGHACTGTYGFANWELLEEAHDLALQKTQDFTTSEMNISSGISCLLRTHTFVAHQVLMALPLGTMDELQHADPVLTKKFGAPKAKF
jgi:NDP-sugar pyrophosphorylase family protein